MSFKDIIIPLLQSSQGIRVLRAQCLWGQRCPRLKEYIRKIEVWVLNPCGLAIELNFKKIIKLILYPDLSNGILNEIHIIFEFNSLKSQIALQKKLGFRPDDLLQLVKITSSIRNLGRLGNVPRHFQSVDLSSEK